ncbi:MAG TPA: hypothetical protein VGK89_09800 [Candidatus Eisenbacteria bacterium]|jgi:hypothetical protein
MVAKRFLFVCAGIFLLAAAYHLGAMSATAQVATGEAGNIEGLDGGVIRYTCAVGRTFYTDLGTPAPVPVPGSARIIATGVGGAHGYHAMLENGDVYWWNSDVPTWQYLGNMLGPATPATQETWGSVKARYRPGAARQDK